jgi:hypothetical protein
VSIAKSKALLYAEDVYMLEGLTDEEEIAFMQDHPLIVPVLDIDVFHIARPLGLVLRIQNHLNCHHKSRVSIAKSKAPLYAKDVYMLEGLTN